MAEPMCGSCYSQEERTTRRRFGNPAEMYLVAGSHEYPVPEFERGGRHREVVRGNQLPRPTQPAVEIRPSLGFGGSKIDDGHGRETGVDLARRLAARL